MGLQNFIEENIRFEILFVLWMFYAWRLYLSLRQRKLMTSLEIPPSSLDGVMSVEDYQKARSYALDKNTYTNCTDLYNIILDTVFILTLAHHHFWQWGIRLIESIDMPGHNTILAAVGCMLVMNAVTTIMNLPFKVYNTFFLKQKHGFDKQTPWFFIKDQWNKFTKMQAGHLPRALINSVAGDDFFSKVWLFCTAITLYKVVLYPEVIAPFWEKHLPLPEGKLKESIEALAASVNFPLHKLYVVYDSKRSSDNDVNINGFYKYKRIILFDTFVKGFSKPVDGKEDQGCEDDEVVGVIAHELGHWKCNHRIKTLLLTQIIFLVNLVIFANVIEYKPMYAAFGFTDTQPLFIGLTIVIMYILNPLNALIGFLQNMNCRRYELQADQIIKKLGHAEPFKRALVKLRNDPLKYPVFDSLYSTFYHTYPKLLERFRSLNKTE